MHNIDRNGSSVEAAQPPSPDAQPPPSTQIQSPNNRSQTPPTTFEQWTEESLKGLKNIELKAILADLGLKKSGNKNVLVDRILGREVVDVATKKKEPKWRNRQGASNASEDAI